MYEEIEIGKQATSETNYYKWAFVVEIVETFVLYYAFHWNRNTAQYW